MFVRASLLLLSALTLNLFSAEPPPAPPTVRTKVVQPEFKPADLKLTPGERLDYEIKVGGVPAGKSLMEVVRQETWPNGAAVWRVHHFTRSNRGISWVYNVQDKHTTIIDQKSGFSRYFRQELREGELKTDEKINFNYDIGDMKATFERLRADGKLREYTLPLQDKVLDPLSALYYLRSINLAALKEKDEFVIPICTEKQVWSTRLIVGPDAPPMDAGRLKNRRVKLLLPQAAFTGLFHRRGPISIWVDEQTGVPLRMTCDVPIGHAEITLEDFNEHTPFGVQP